jgi:hypothetical protein
MRFENDLPTGIGKNSWYMKLPLKEGRGNLFENSDEPFIIHAFYCHKCKHCQTIISTKAFKQHICICGNDYFYDVNLIANRHGNLLVNIEMIPVLEKTSTHYSAKLYLDIPTGIDLSKNKLLFNKQQIYEIQMDFKGTETIKSIYKPSDYVCKKLNNVLLQFIGEDLETRIERWNSLEFKTFTDSKKLLCTLFFLKNPCFKEAEFFFWHRHQDKSIMEYYNHAATTREALDIIVGRNEKCVKRSLYTRYTKEIETGKFDPMVPYIIGNIFDDINHICKLLEDPTITFDSEEYMDTALNSSDVLKLFQFLKKQYSPIQIMKLIREIKSEIQIFIDICQMYVDAEDSINRFSHKVKVSLLAIHDEFIRCAHMEEHTITYDFQYKSYFNNACIKEHPLEFKLPSSGKELLKWSNFLNNCMFSYASAIHAGYTVIYGVFKAERLAYGVEIHNDVIVQMSGKSNRGIESGDRNSIEQWYKKYFTKNSQKSPLTSNAMLEMEQ